MMGVFQGQFRLRWRIAPVHDFGGMEQYNELWNGLFIGRGLHCVETSLVENFKHGWTKIHDCQYGDTSLLGEFSKGQVSWATSNSWTSPDPPLCLKSKWLLWSLGQMPWMKKEEPEVYKGHFTHKTESPWPIHFKHSHWCKRWSRSNFASHCTWGTNGICEYTIDVSLHGFLHGIKWIMLFDVWDLNNMTIFLFPKRVVLNRQECTIVKGVFDYNSDDGCWEMKDMLVLVD
jgi:hypothetical protein